MTTLYFIARECEKEEELERRKKGLRPILPANK
jgi:hypothetical protein